MYVLLFEKIEKLFWYLNDANEFTVNVDFWIKVSLSCICKTRIIYLAYKTYFSLLCLENYFEIMLAYQYEQIVYTEC